MILVYLLSARHCAGQRATAIQAVLQVEVRGKEDEDARGVGTGKSK